MAVYGWVKSVSLEYDPTVRKNVSCKDCIYYDSDDKSCNRRGLYLPEDGYNSWKNCRDFEMDKHTANYEEKLIKAMKFGYKPPKLEEKKNSTLKAVSQKNTAKDIPSTAGREKKDLAGYSIFPFEGKLKDTTSEKVRCGYFIFGIKQKKVPAFLCEKAKTVYISLDCFQKYHDEISAQKLYLWFDKKN